MIARILMILLLTSLAIAGCRKSGNPDQNDEPASAAPKSNELPPLELRDDSPNLLLTWVDDKGDFHVVLKPGDVPDGRRDKVRVVVTTREEGTGQLVYVADLTKKNANGSFAVSTLTRAQWDEVGASRRKARLEALAPSASALPPGASPPGEAPSALPPGSQVVAIIYGAEWCKPCHDAARYLRQRGVSVVEKNIENSQAAAAELRAKLARANLAPSSSIPIIDVMGRLLVGYDPRALEQAIEAARSAKTL